MRNWLVYLYLPIYNGMWCWHHTDLLNYTYHPSHLVRLMNYTDCNWSRYCRQPPDTHHWCIVYRSHCSCYYLQSRNPWMPLHHMCLLAMHCHCTLLPGSLQSCTQLSSCSVPCTYMPCSQSIRCCHPCCMYRRSDLHHSKNCTTYMRSSYVHQLP